jgi:SAM-dependent methyltransferase
MGVDISAPMLDRARERVRDSAMRNVRLMISDAAVHAFEPNAFDLAFSRFGVMFFDDPERAFANSFSARRNWAAGLCLLGAPAGQSMADRAVDGGWAALATAAEERSRCTRSFRLR